MIDPELNTIRPYGPGKFDTYVDSYVYDASLDGGCDEEVGSTDESGWYGLMQGDSVRGLAECIPSDVTPTVAERELLETSAGAILSENSQGFVSVEYFQTVEELLKTWAEICGELETGE